jgi:esterase
VSVVRLASHRWGVGAPSILLIHGLGDGRFVWRGLEELLGEMFAGASIDLRGHGDSPRDALRRYDPASLASDLESLVDGLDWPKLVLVGHCLGAEVAVQVAVTRAERISGIVMIEGGPELKPAAALRMREDIARLPPSFSAIAEFEDTVVPRHPLAERAALHRYAQAALIPASSGGFELKLDPALIGSLPPQDAQTFWSQLDAMICPMLLVRGRLSSALTRRKAQELTARVPRAVCVEVPGAGHAVPLENPAGLHEAMLSFLESIDVRGALTSTLRS